VQLYRPHPQDYFILLHLSENDLLERSYGSYSNSLTLTTIHTHPHLVNSSYSSSGTLSRPVAPLSCQRYNAWIQLFAERTSRPNLESPWSGTCHDAHAVHQRANTNARHLHILARIVPPFVRRIIYDGYRSSVCQAKIMIPLVPASAAALRLIARTPT